MPGPIRLSNNQRMYVVDKLSEALARGFITMTDFEERTGKVTAAVYTHQITPLTADLPWEYHTLPTESHFEHEEAKRERYRALALIEKQRRRRARGWLIFWGSWLLAGFTWVFIVGTGATEHSGPWAATALLLFTWQIISLMGAIAWKLMTPALPPRYDWDDGGSL